MVELNFQVEEASPGRSLIEAGNYVAEIVDCVERESKAGNKYLSIQFRIEGKGSVWDQLNLWHPKPEVISIANEKMSAIGRAIGASHISDTDQLLAKQLTINVGVENDPHYGPKNVVKSFAPQGKRPEPAAAASPPWRAA